MQRDRQYLLDVIEASDRIARYLDGMDLATFERDDRTRSAVIYQLIVVGEATNRVSENVRQRYPEAPWQLAVDTRNLFAHQYVDLNWERLWRTATISIPEFRAQITAILAAEFPEDEEE